MNNFHLFLSKPKPQLIWTFPIYLRIRNAQSKTKEEIFGVTRDRMNTALTHRRCFHNFPTFSLIHRLTNLNYTLRSLPIYKLTQLPTLFIWLRNTFLVQQISTIHTCTYVFVFVLPYHCSGLCDLRYENSISFIACASSVTCERDR